ncbi:MAG: hypothetical protein ACYC96_15205 [Fimbriimonadaceae bacterium]
MLAPGDRVRLDAVVVRVRGDSVTLQLGDGQAVFVGLDHLTPGIENKALRPPARKGVDASHHVPD